MSLSPEPAPLVPVALAVAAGLALGPSLGARPGLWWGLGSLSVLASVATRSRLQPLVLCLGFLCLGLARASAPLAPPAPVGETAVWEVELERSTADPSAGVSVTLLACWTPLQEPGGRRRLWRGSEPAQLQVGAWPALGGPPGRGSRLLVLGRLRSAGPRRPTSSAVLRVRRPHHVHRLSAGEGLLDRLRGGVDRAVDRARVRVRATLALGAPGEGHGLALALVLADRSQLDPARRDAFARTGTAHLLAISGLHVGSLAAVLGFCVRWPLRRLPLGTHFLQSGGPDKAALATALAGSCGYVLLAGAPVSARRALVMVGAVVLAGLLDRRVSAWNALAGAVILVGWLEPAAVRSLGFQLSVASVAGLLALVPGGREERGSARWRRLMTGGFTSSLAATLATAPLCARAWGVVPLAGLWVNPVAVPLLGVATVPLLLAGCGLGLLSPAVGAPLVRLAAVVARLGCRLVEWASLPSRCPLWSWEPASWTVPLAYVLLAAVCWSLVAAEGSEQ